MVATVPFNNVDSAKSRPVFRCSKVSTPVLYQNQTQNSIIQSHELGDVYGTLRKLRLLLHPILLHVNLLQRGEGRCDLENMTLIIHDGTHRQQARDLDLLSTRPPSAHVLHGILNRTNKSARHLMLCIHQLTVFTTSHSNPTSTPPE